MATKMRLLPQLVSSLHALDTEDRIVVNAACAVSGLMHLLCEGRGWHVKALLWAGVAGMCVII
jgi:hypothetical protein